MGAADSIHAIQIEHSLSVELHRPLTLGVKMITGRKNYFRIIFGGSTGKSCKSPGGYYIIKYLGNSFSHPVRAPFLRNLCGSGTETGGGGLLQDRGSYRKNVWGIIFGGST